MQIDLRTLTSDQARRDNFIRQNTLKTDQFPYVEFRSTESAGPALFRPGEEATFQIPGIMTVRGQERPIVWEAKAKRAVSFAPPVDTMPIQIGLDAEGKELAIAYVDGRVLWADVAGLRANALERPATLTPFKPASCTNKWVPRRYDELIARPEQQAARVNSFLAGRVDLRAMADAVEPSLHRNRKTSEEQPAES